MKNKTKSIKDFDCVKFVRDQRERASADLFGMTQEEIVAHFKKVAEESSPSTDNP